MPARPRRDLLPLGRTTARAELLPSDRNAEGDAGRIDQAGDERQDQESEHRPLVDDEACAERGHLNCEPDDHRGDHAGKSREPRKELSERVH